MMRDTWRAVLVVVVAILLREVLSTPVRRNEQPVYNPPPMYFQPQYHPPVHGNEQPRPLRRIGEAVVELGDSLIGAIRR
jgi:hypothetical protein